MISGLLNTLHNENESVLENGETQGLHRNVWKTLMEKIDSMNNSMDSSVFPQIVQTVSTHHIIHFKELWTMFSMQLTDNYIHGNSYLNQSARSQVQVTTAITYTFYISFQILQTGSADRF